MRHSFKVCQVLLPPSHFGSPLFSLLFSPFLSAVWRRRQFGFKEKTRLDGNHSNHCCCFAGFNVLSVCFFPALPSPSSPSISFHFISRHCSVGNRSTTANANAARQAEGKGPPIQMPPEFSPLTLSAWAATFSIFWFFLIRILVCFAVQSAASRQLPPLGRGKMSVSSPLSSFSLESVDYYY